MRDAQSFDDFYRGTVRRMVRYGYAVTGDHNEAQDLVQEAYARAWRQWGRLSAHPAPEAWLRLVVSRLATDRWRRLGGLRGALRLAGPPPPVPPPNEDSVLLVQACVRCRQPTGGCWRCTTCSTCPSRRSPERSTCRLAL